MKDVFPTFRGEEDSSVTMDMVDRFGRTWGRAKGESRTDAIARARKSSPPSGVIRRILSSATRHPMRTAFLTATAFHTYHSLHKIDDDRNRPGIGSLIVYSIVAYVGIKLLSWILGDVVEH
jgi:hypothetical protein